MGRELVLKFETNEKWLGEILSCLFAEALLIVCALKLKRLEMNKPKFKSGRGGWRGGGRPKGSTIPLDVKRVNLTGIRLPKWLVDWVKSQEESGGRVIESALVKYFKLEAPERKLIRMGTGTYNPSSSYGTGLVEASDPDPGDEKNLAER